MPHLDPERLAALADEPPTADEAAHLATCLACRRERGAHQALLALVRELGPDAGPAAPAAEATDEPLVPWAALAGALRDEGLVRTPEPVALAGAPPAADVVALDAVRARRAAVAPAVPGRWSAGVRRAAAAVLLLAAGAALGRASAGVAPAPGTAPVVAVAPSGGSTPGAPPAADPAARSADETTIPAGEAVAESPDRPDAGSARLASDDGGETLVFRSVTEATAVLTRAQRDYQRAAAWLAAHDSTGVEAGGPETLRTRLAALDEVMPSVRQALREAPQDPVLNHVYLTAYDVRESTLRQLGRALPVGVRLEGY